jgi:hypothetical protein
MVVVSLIYVGHRIVRRKLCTDLSEVTELSMENKKIPHGQKSSKIKTENCRIKINTLKHRNGLSLFELGTFSNLACLCYVLQYCVMENIVMFLRVPQDSELS